MEPTANSTVTIGTCIGWTIERSGLHSLKGRTDITASRSLLVRGAFALLLIAFNLASPPDASAQQINVTNKSDRSLNRNPASIPARLRSLRPATEALFQVPVLQDALQPWYNIKQQLADEAGLELGFFYAPMWQRVPSIPAPRQGAGGTFGIEAYWNLVGRGTDSPGYLQFRAQDRHRYADQLPPTALFVPAGQLWPTTVGYNEFDLSILELSWAQHIIKDRLVFLVGKTIPFANHDYFRYKSPFSGFNDAAFTVNPTIAWAPTALGAAIGFRPSDTTYVKFGAYDANGQPQRSGFETLFELGELFYVLEVGWDPGYYNKDQAVYIGDLLVSDIHVLYWHKDRLSVADAPEGWGLSVFAEGEIGRFVPFIRAGMSDGPMGGPAILNYMVGGGVGIRNVFGQDNDVIGIGAAWGSRDVGRIDTDGDNIPDLDVGNVSQVSTEAFYRIQVLRELTVTPHIEVVFNPALDPTRDVSTVIGIRGRFGI